MLIPYDTTSRAQSQAQKKLSDHKAESRVLAKHLEEAGKLDDASRVYHCGDTILLERWETGEEKIVGAMFCHHRLCPMCAWRRSRKAAGQLSKVMAVIDRCTDKPSWIAITISPRAETYSVSDAGDIMMNLKRGWAKLWRNRPPCMLGAFRAIELRQSDGAINPSAKGKWQPHIHGVICVRKSYWTSRDYWSHSKWLSECADAFGYDETSISVHIERIDAHAGKLQGAAAETAKYIVKPAKGINDLSIPDLKSLVEVLHRQRLYAYYGLMRDIWHTLYASDDAESPNADLVHDVDEAPIDPRIPHWFIWMQYLNGTYFQTDGTEAPTALKAAALKMLSNGTIPPEDSTLVLTWRTT